MSFDNRIMNSLLSDEHSDLFNEDYPIFYKNKINKGKYYIKQEDGKINKYCYRNALDIAV